MNIKKSIPNTITCCSLLSGCVAVLLALRGDLQWAAYWVMAAAVFDFCDGLAARTLQAFSPIGKDLDSLSDMVSFGVAPGMIVFRLLEEACQTEPTMGFVPYLAFVIPVFSALRLAKFNIDERQTTSFIGMPYRDASSGACAVLGVNWPCVARRCAGRAYWVYCGRGCCGFSVVFLTGFRSADVFLEGEILEVERERIPIFVGDMGSRLCGQFGRFRNCRRYSSLHRLVFF